MRAKCQELLLLSVILAALVCVEFLWPLAEETGDEVAAVEISLALPDQGPDVKPTPPPADPVPVPAPQGAVAVSAPVQPVEERGDALLFESEALFGTPFDQAIVMPFD